MQSDRGFNTEVIHIIHSSEQVVQGIEPAANFLSC